MSYAIDDPEPYVDCGNITVTTSGGVSGNGTVTFPAARKMYIYNISDGTPHAKLAKRTVTLSGKMNVVFTELEKNKVQVSVNSRYVLHGKITTERFIQSGWSGYMQPHTETFSTFFNTGQPSEGCAAKNTLEKSVLDTIEKELLKTN